MGKLGVIDVRPWLMGRWKAHGRLSIGVGWTFFAIYYGSRVMRWNVYSSAVFAGYRSLCTQVLPGQGPPINHYWHQKTRGIGLSDGEDCIAFLCANSFWHNNGVWRTDRQKDGRADLPCSTYSAVKTTTQSRCAIFKNKTFIHHVSRIQHCRKDKRYGFAGSVLILSELLYPAVWRTIIACRFAQIIVYLICLKKTINCYRCLSYRPTSITV